LTSAVTHSPGTSVSPRCSAAPQSWPIGCSIASCPDWAASISRLLIANLPSLTPGKAEWYKARGVSARPHDGRRIDGAWMIRQKSQILCAWFLVWDLGMTVLAWLVAYYIRFESGLIPL